MRTYTVTQILSLWHVHLYDDMQDHLSSLQTHFSDESAATKFALLHAESNRPSEVLAIAKTGDKVRIAVFDIAPSEIVQ